MMRGGSNNVMSSDKEVSQRGTSEKMKFIGANLRAFDEIREGKRALETYHSLKRAMEEDELTPGQISLVDIIYEKMMKGLGFDSFEPTYNHNPKKTLRH